jgi:hypothetical protein
MNQEDAHDFLGNRSICNTYSVQTPAILVCL